MTLSKTKVVAGAAGPTVKVVVEGKTLKAKTDYTLSIGSTKKVGTVSAKITGKGAYKETLTKSFKVIPAKAKIAKATAGKKKVTVALILSWNVDVTDQGIQKIKEKKYEVNNIEDSATEVIGDEKNLEEMGTVYRDPETGKYYVVED